MTKVVFSALMVLTTIFCMEIPENTCPYFSYRNSEYGYTFGRLNLPNDGSGQYDLLVYASMRGVFDMLPKMTVMVTTSVEELLSGYDIEYSIYFPFWDNIPKITMVSLNGRVYCSGPAYSVSPKMGTTTMWSQYFYDTGKSFTELSGTPESPIQYLPKVPDAPTQESRQKPLRSIQRTEAKSCGVSSDTSENASFRIFNGSPVSEGQYPWLVALYLYDGTAMGSYKCVANLISANHLVTAAHCVFRFPRENLFLQFSSAGALDQPPNFSRTISDIKISPLYITEPFGDMALLTMNESVSFNTYIKPICLWKDDEPVGNIGTVAGWGIDEYGFSGGIAKAVDLVIESPKKCIETYNLENEYRLFTEYCFCTARKNASPCRGDSGAAFMVKHNGRFFLRGVLSVGHRFCGTSEYAVFVDIVPQLEWIMSSLN